jgi:hypothetical protein
MLAPPRRHVEPARPVQVVPLRLVPPVRVEHLDAMVLPVRHIDPAIRVAGDVVDDVELARIRPGLTPGQQMPPVRREFVHAGVAIPVRHIDLSDWRQRGMGTTVERLAAHIRRRPARNPECQQHLALERALPDRVVGIVGQPDRVVRPHVQPVRAREHPLAPGPDKIAVPIEHDHRVLAAVEHIDPVLPVRPDPADLLEPPTRRQLAPPLDRLVPPLALAQRHVRPPSPVWPGRVDLD